jgi:hypothetical protein
MAIYSLSDPPRRLLRQRRQGALRLLGYVSLVAIAFGWTRSPVMLDVAKIAGMIALATAYGLWSIQRRIDGGRSVSIRVSADGVSATDARGVEKHINRADIVCVRPLSPAAGFWIGSSHPRAFIIVPPDLDGYDACRAELVGMGIPEEPRTAKTRVKMWSLVGLMYSIVAACIVGSQTMRLAAAAVFVASAGAAWASGVWSSKTTARACPAPDRSPDAQARTRTTIKRFAVALIAIGVVTMMAEAWWTKGTGDLGFGIVTAFIGAIVFAIALSDESFKTNALAFGALAVAGAVVGGLAHLVAPRSDLGSLIAIAIAAFATLGLVMTLIAKGASRLPWLNGRLDLVVGAMTAGVGVIQLRRGHADGWIGLAAGAIVSALACAAASGRWRPLALKISMVVRVAAIAAAAIGFVMGDNTLTNDAISVAVFLPGTFKRAVDPAGAGAPVA